MSKGKELKRQAQLERAASEKERREKARERIAASPKVEQVQPDFRALHTVGGLQRKAIGIASRGAVISELREAATEDQIDALNQTVAGQRPAKLRKALMSKAPAEMDKAIRQFKKEGKEVSVDALCAEIKSTPSFLSMCERVGLDVSWFENLAKERMEAHGL